MRTSSGATATVSMVLYPLARRPSHAFWESRLNVVGASGDEVAEDSREERIATKPINVVVFEGINKRLGALILRVNLRRQKCSRRDYRGIAARA